MRSAIMEVERMSEDQISPPTGGMLGQWADRITETGWFKFLKIFQVVAIIIAVVVFGIDYQQRQQDRGVRAEEHAARVEEHKARAEERNARAEDRLARMWGLATEQCGHRSSASLLSWVSTIRSPSPVRGPAGVYLGSDPLPPPDVAVARVQSQADPASINIWRR